MSAPPSQRLMARPQRPSPHPRPDPNRQNLFGEVRGFLAPFLVPRFLLPLLGLLALFLWINYQFDFRLRYVPYRANELWRLPATMLYYATPVLTALLLLRGVAREHPLRLGPQQLLLLLAPPLLYSLAALTLPFAHWLQEHTAPGIYSALLKPYSLISRSLLTIFLPAGTLWLARRHLLSYQTPVEPAAVLGRHIYPILLVAGVALAALASLEPSFAHFYPLYRPGREAAVLGAPPWLLFLGWETIYLASFVAVEYFFRGFMLRLYRPLLGPAAIWPMATMYMFIHFSKPLGEAVASFGGGLLLGILAYRTQSIKGGILLHCGLALSMDLFALWQRGGL